MPQYGCFERISYCLVPKGTYLIDGTLGGDSNQKFRNAGIIVPGNLEIMMDPECIIKVIPNSSWGIPHFM